MVKRRRAPSGTGTVYARRDRPGTWVAEIEVAGKRQRTYHPSREQAEAGLEAMRTGAGIRTRGERESLGTWLTYWASQLAPKKVEPKTAAYYQSVVRSQWMPSALAGRPLASVAPLEIEAALEAMLGSVSRTTVGHARAVLSAAYTAAVREQRAPGNPVAATRMKNLPGRIQAPRVRTLNLSREIAQAISDAVAETPDRALVEVMLNAGLRPAEALALRWGDLTLRDPMTIRVRQAINQVGTGWVVGVPKTTLSTRDIPLDPSPSGLRPVLFAQRDRLEKLMGRPLKPDDLLFQTPAGKPDNPVSLSRRFRVYADAAGLSGWTPRDLRTLHASLMIADGESIAVVSRRLGHSDPVTTWRRYIGVPTKADRAAARTATSWGRARRPKGEPGAEATQEDATQEDATA